eukprot:TRINITY_DN10797_c0_g2_i1.p1 TRINITY_DN10797_c0_g2~~TRINITY_DN10797_c0_g2_i1.p1  ORF type:complete len:172 (+),score=22.24 TRINITY_DN10797_c0_g2_i1:227-742(+)
MHHRLYVTKLNVQIVARPIYKEMSLEEVVRAANGAIYNNAAQAWNHTFFFHCMDPNGGGAPTGRISDGINQHWGSFEKFKEEFTSKAMGVFGSGNMWLVYDPNLDSKGGLRIVETHDGECPLVHDLRPVLTVDLWEHSYYIDFRNDRAKFLEAWWSCVNWEFANENLATCP